MRGFERSGDVSTTASKKALRAANCDHGSRILIAHADIVQSGVENGRCGRRGPHRIRWVLAVSIGGGGVFTLKAGSDTPYFRIAFASVTAINAGFLALFALAAFQLVRLRKSGVIVHTATSALLIAYTMLIGSLWLVRGRIGMSIGAATGVGNMGIAPFGLLFVVPYVAPIVSTLALIIVPPAYPIASTFVLHFTRRKMAEALSASGHVATV